MDSAKAYELAHAITGPVSTKEGGLLEYALVDLLLKGWDITSTTLLPESSKHSISATSDSLSRTFIPLFDYDQFSSEWLATLPDSTTLVFVSSGSMVTYHDVSPGIPVITPQPR